MPGFVAESRRSPLPEIKDRIITRLNWCERRTGFDCNRALDYREVVLTNTYNYPGLLQGLYREHYRCTSSVNPFAAAREVSFILSCYTKVPHRRRLSVIQTMGSEYRPRSWTPQKNTEKQIPEHGPRLQKPPEKSRTPINSPHSNLISGFRLGMSHGSTRKILQVRVPSCFV